MSKVLSDEELAEIEKKLNLRRGYITIKRGKDLLATIDQLKDDKAELKQTTHDCSNIIRDLHSDKERLMVCLDNLRWNCTQDNEHSFCTCLNIHTMEKRSEPCDYCASRKIEEEVDAILKEMEGK